MALRIEKTELRDLDRICEIENASFSDPWSASAFRAAIDDPLIRFISAFADNSADPAGYAIMRVLLDEAEILSIAVSDEYRRRGIGREMMTFLLDGACADGVSNVYLEVRESNTAARELYGSLGFAPIGKRRKYYTKPTEDAIVMCAVLDPESDRE